MNRCNIFNRPIWLALGSMISITGLSGGATLTGSAQKLTAGAVIEVTAAGVVDWVHWGLHTETSVNRKASVMPQISDFEAVLPISPNTNRGTYIFQFGDNV